MPGIAAIPHFYLYGDPHSDVDMDFLHAEPIRDRSGTHDWTIRTHAHPDHAQLLLVTEGGGWIRVEERRYEVLTPALLIIPLASAHDMAFAAGTDGEVIAVAKGYLSDPALGAPELLAALNRPAALGLEDAESLALLREVFARLGREFIWRAPFRRQAITALFLQILVHAARLGEAGRGAEAGPDRNYDLLNRFRTLLERDFRQHKRLEHYAGGLG